MRLNRSVPRNLKIAFVIGTLGRGGAEIQLCRLAAELERRGHHVRVYALAEGGPLEQQLRDDGIHYEIVSFPGFGFRNVSGRLAPRRIALVAATFLRFWWTMVRFRPHVCHAFLPHAYIMAMPVAAAALVPVRITARRSLPSRIHLPARLETLHRLSSRLAHAVVANSHAVAEDARQVEPEIDQRLHVIENGVDIPVATSDAGRAPAGAVVLANLIAYKGHADLLDALEKIERPPHVQLLGDGPERGRLETMVAEKGLGDHVEFVGAVADPARFLENAQFAIHPSHEEGMPNAILEEMSWGLPVVATAVGGSAELVHDHVTGLLVAPHDATELATAITTMANDHDRRKRFGEAARTRASSFSWERCVDHHLEFYHRVLRQPRGWWKSDVQT